MKSHRWTEADRESGEASTCLTPADSLTSERFFPRPVSLSRGPHHTTAGPFRDAPNKARRRGLGLWPNSERDLRPSRPHRPLAGRGRATPVSRCVSEVELGNQGEEGS